MDFDCDFNAPMFVDFQNMDGDHQEQEHVEAYFEVDHPDHERDQNDKISITPSLNHPTEIKSDKDATTESTSKSNTNTESRTASEAKTHTMDDDSKVYSPCFRLHLGYD